MLKKLTLTLALACATSSMFGQGLINFNTQTIGTITKVRDMAGTLLAGNGYYAALYYAVGADRAEADLSPIAGQPLRTFQGGGVAGWVRHQPTNGLGQAVNATVALTDVTAAGTQVTLQLRAWSAPFQSFAEAQAGGGQYGSSARFNVAPGFPPATPANLNGLVGFNLVPEPSTIGLGILGATALLFLRKRKA